MRSPVPSPSSRPTETSRSPRWVSTCTELCGASGAAWGAADCAVGRSAGDPDDPPDEDPDPDPDDDSGGLAGAGGRGTGRRGTIGFVVVAARRFPPYSDSEYWFSRSPGTAPDATYRGRSPPRMSNL